MKCDFYIDDLPEILQNQFFPSSCHKILFDPESNYQESNFKEFRASNFIKTNLESTRSLKKITKQIVKYSKFTKFIKNTNDNIEKKNSKLING